MQHLKYSSSYNRNQRIPKSRTSLVFKRLVTSNNIPNASVRERSTELHFLGKYKEDKEILHDKIHSNLNEEISKSHFTFKDNDWKIFSQQIHHVISKCEKLQPSSPFKLRSQLLFVGKNSLLSNHIIEIMEMCFTKSISNFLNKPYEEENIGGCKYNKNMGYSNNNSGYFYVGSNGIGKSSLLKIMCLISSLMIPNLVSIFIDCAPIDIPLIYSLNEGLNQFYHSSTAKNSIKSMGEILNKAGEEGVTMGVFIDESQCLYKPEPWSYLHELITSFDHCLL